MISNEGDHPYIIAALARSIGEVKENGEARDSFRAAFDALDALLTHQLTCDKCNVQ
jgi:hypothetical protein